MGTDEGQVLKMAVLGSNPIVISVQQVLPPGRRVKELTVAQETQTVIVVGDDNVAAIPMHKCHEMAL